MNYIDLLNNIDKNNLRNINLLQVEDKYFLDLSLKTLKNDFIGNDFLDFNYEKVDFQTLEKEKFQTMVETLPLMSDRRLVVIDNCDFNKDSLKKYEELLNSIFESFENFNDMTYLFFIYNSDKLFKGKFVKQIEKFGQIYTFSRLNQKDFYGFVRKFFVNNGINIEMNSVRLIADRLRYLDKDSNKTLFEVENEISKLLNNIKSKSPTYDEIEESIIDTFEEKIFGLLDYMSTKDLKKSLTSYKTMKNEDQMMIYYMIIRQVRNMICVRDCHNKKINMQTGQSYCALSPFEYKKLEKLVKNYNMNDLLKLHELCYKSEVNFKTSKRKIEDIIERMILEFCIGSSELI